MLLLICPGFSGATRRTRLCPSKSWKEEKQSERWSRCSPSANDDALWWLQWTCRSLATTTTTRATTHSWTRCRVSPSRRFLGVMIGFLLLPLLPIHAGPKFLKESAVCLQLLLSSGSRHYHSFLHYYYIPPLITTILLNVFQSSATNATVKHT